MRDNASQDKTFPPNIPTEYLGLQFDVTASFTQLYIQDSGSRSLINLCVSSHPSLLVSFFYFFRNISTQVYANMPYCLRGKRFV